MQLAAIEVSEPDFSRDADLVVVPSNDPVVVDVPAESCTDGMVARLKETLATYPGTAPVHLRMLSSTGVTTLKLGEGYRVDGSEGLLSELRRLLGRDHVRVG
jgi:DNA polymerase-3 subunit alpha